MKKLSTRAIYIAIFAAIWQSVYYLEIFPAMLFPSVFDIFSSLYKELLDGSLIIKVGYTLYLIFLGILVSFGIIVVFVLLSSLHKNIKNYFISAVSVLDPLPGIALLPLAILWFGVGKGAIVFVMAHSIIWPVLLAILLGFDSIPKIYKEVALNMQIPKTRMLIDIYIPAAMASIIMGLKSGWARAWRALIAAEMIFGTTGALGGLGWDIYIKRSYLDMPGMLATLIVLMVIGILVEDLLFKFIENKTIKKWGVVS
ncbi:ABC transporter permease [Campylobacter vicugnae]|uniref:ABC transporter permease n=1 Tax=Campylobacter vicugnae TaxID=1660076 RepID=UPI00254B1066|nr:ABC transporter permease subunit [Campylobacter ovis]MDL0095180.1 ABC transporter permease subunit [Campylobacter ovis]